MVQTSYADRERDLAVGGQRSRRRPSAGPRPGSRGSSGWPLGRGRCSACRSSVQGARRRRGDDARDDEVGSGCGKTCRPRPMEPRRGESSVRCPARRSSAETEPAFPSERTCVGGRSGLRSDRLRARSSRPPASVPRRGGSEVHPLERRYGRAPPCGKCGNPHAFESAGPTRRFTCERAARARCATAHPACGRSWSGPPRPCAR